MEITSQNERTDSGLLRQAGGGMAFPDTFFSPDGKAFVVLFRGHGVRSAKHSGRIAGLIPDGKEAS